MRYYCTYLDHNYLSRGLALYESLREHCHDFRLWILCFDDQSCCALDALALPEVQSIALAQLEASDPDLLQIKKNRSRIEYYFTCGPSLCLFIINKDRKVDLLTYVDSDLFLFDDPEPVFQEIGTSSIAMTEHRFPRRLKKLERYGVFNVGWLTFRRDEHGSRCLRWWRDRCQEWCYDRVEQERYADQKYLDCWPSLFKRVRIITHKGINTAPWNISNYQVLRKNGQVYLDDQPLIFYHFQGLRRLIGSLYDAGMGKYHAKLSTSIRRWIYTPYLQALAKASRLLGKVQRDIPTELGNSRTSRQESVLMDLLAGLKRLSIGGYLILRGDTIRFADSPVSDLDEGKS